MCPKKITEEPKYIELFAGCGGLSLGLDSAGFERVFANELSPMAAETYAYNLLSEDLRDLSKGALSPQKTLWISSQYPVGDLSNRLVENPHKYPVIGEGHSELGTSLGSLCGKLLVGDIRQLNEFLQENKQLQEELHKADIDLVSGGPPCQSFSVAGLRQHDNERNTLPMDFADFVSMVNPKVVVLENVSGILRAFSLPGNERYYAWFEVARAFASKGFYPLCLNVNAKFAGVAQNRPRFLMFAFREDVFEELKLGKQGPGLGVALQEIDAFVDSVADDSKVETLEAGVDLNYHDFERNSELVAEPLFRELAAYFLKDKWHTAEHAIDDLSRFGKNAKSNPYLGLISRRFPKRMAGVVRDKRIANRALRDNGLKVQQRFLLYQYLAEKRARGEIDPDVRRFLRGVSSNLSLDSYEFLKKKAFLDAEGEMVRFSENAELWAYLVSLASKKHAQRALVRNEPAAATLSIPDDVCHYNQKELRTLSVREMARIQSFPDWFVFRGKPTTGGGRRKFEVPQYTQVGNAVPPLLGVAIGKIVKRVLDRRG